MTKWQSRRGSLAVFAIWILVLFSLLAVSIGYRQRLEAKAMLYQKNNLKNLWHAVGLTHIVQYLIENDTEDGIDHLGKVIFGIGSIQDQLPWLEEVRIRVTDEERKLNVNTASKEQLEFLFKTLKSEIDLDLNPEDLAEEIIDYRTKGVKTEGLSQNVRQQSFSTMGALLTLKELSTQDYLILRDYMTVYGQAGVTAGLRVNVNTASKHVLRTVVESLPGDERDEELVLDRFFEYREKELDPEEEEERNYFIDNELDPYRLAELLELPSTVTMVSLLTLLRPLLTTDSAFYTIEVQSTNAFSKTGRRRITIGPAQGQGQVNAANPGIAQLNNLGIVNFAERDRSELLEDTFTASNLTNVVQQGIVVLEWYED